MFITNKANGNKCEIIFIFQLKKEQLKFKFNLFQ